MKNKVLKNYEVPCFQVVYQTESDIIMTSEEPSVFVDQGDFFE
jgi:hypothetical protein